MPNAFLYGVGGGKLPTLSELSVSANGTYSASDYSVDGFSVVNVNVTGETDELVEYFNGTLKGTLNLGSIESTSTISIYSNSNVAITKIEYYGSSTSLNLWNSPAWRGLKEFYAPNLKVMPNLGNCQDLRILTLHSDAYLTASTTTGVSATLLSEVYFPNAEFTNSPRLSYAKISCSSLSSFYGGNYLEINIPNTRSIYSGAFSVGALTYYWQSALLSFNMENLSYLSSSNNTIGGLFSEIRFNNPLFNYITLGHNTYHVYIGNYIPGMINLNIQYLLEFSFSNVYGMATSAKYIGEIYSLSRLNISSSFTLIGSTLSVLSTSYLTFLSTGYGANANTTIFEVSLPNLSQIAGLPINVEHFSCSLLERFFNVGISSVPGLSYISIPNCTSLGNSAFYMCTGLSMLELYCTTINTGAFNSCYNLISLTLLASSVCTLGSNCFVSTPMTNNIILGYFGSIYVPSSLYNDYIVATNWVSLSNRITSI